MKFRDVAHFYLGVEVQTKIRLATKSGEQLEKAKGQLREIDLHYDDHFGILLHSETDKTHYVNLSCNSFKPILLSLEDLTNEHRTELQNLTVFGDWPEISKQFHFLTSKGYDVFGLIESGQAIRKTK